MSEQSEQDIARGNTIENWGHAFVSEGSERNTIRGG